MLASDLKSFTNRLMEEWAFFALIIDWMNTIFLFIARYSYLGYYGLKSVTISCNFFFKKSELFFLSVY